jgi:hypothetical protein
LWVLLNLFQLIGTDIRLDWETQSYSGGNFDHVRNGNEMEKWYHDRIRESQENKHKATMTYWFALGAVFLIWETLGRTMMLQSTPSSLQQKKWPEHTIKEQLTRNQTLGGSNVTSVGWM